ncbi:MAG: lysylphosphatidylglycerol synthase transmembrane domain-containing protein [Planctomycetota bacterium]|jgi:uncharacterized protein (TIRG00374 family)
MPDSEKKKHLFLFLRLAVVIIGIICGVLWVRAEDRWSRLVEIFGDMNLGIFACALCVFITGQLTLSLRWLLLIRTQSIHIKFWPAVRLVFLGLFYNNFMPSSVGGDLIRAWYVTKHTDKKFEAVLSVFVDRVVGLTSTLIIAAFFYVLFLRGKGCVIGPGESKSGGAFEFIVQRKAIFIGLIVVVGAAFCGLLLHRQGRVLLKKICLSFEEHGLRLIKKFRDAIVIYCKRPLAILAAFGLTVLLQMMTITAFWFLGADMGIEASAKYYYVFFTLTWVLGAVPVSIGGAVVVEATLAYLFIHFAGVGEELAAALALCQRAVWMLASLPGAVIHLLGAHLPKEFFIDYDKSIN